MTHDRRVQPVVLGAPNPTEDVLAINRNGRAFRNGDQALARHCLLRSAREQTELAPRLTSREARADIDYSVRVKLPIWNESVMTLNW